MKIGDRTLDEWAVFARRDDCLERMVPSDLRLLISAIRQQGEPVCRHEYGHTFMTEVGRVHECGRCGTLRYINSHSV